MVLIANLMQLMKVCSHHCVLFSQFVKNKLSHTLRDSSITVSAECKDRAVCFHSFGIEYSGTLYNGHHWEPTFCPS